MNHKHKLKIVRIPGITMRFKCILCNMRFVYWRDGIRKVVAGKNAFKTSYQMGNW